MENDYFSVEAILAENQKIQCTFKHEIPNMGHLGGGTERERTKLQLPMWLAYVIIYSDWAEFNIPQPFGLKVRNALKAEATSVRLSNLVGAGGMWYGFGKMIMDMLSDEQASEMSEMMTKAFKDAQHFAAIGPGGAGGSGSDGLDATEREIFTLAQASAKRMKKWHEESDKAKQ
ncbi:hypothetical protein FA13DRAFT_1767849 [Coprinellus micaceus]|uniref:DNA replication complex GINS protein PSF3 n=1 Tax=Coprinellus micaceus TaxID=71717 RepID=A0A4Y7S886_COPMI|nr:hypothetical protein FA13DRAFT_1767849 [Coprinellus micaceus]